MIYLNGRGVYINKFPNGESRIETEGLKIEKENIIKLKFEDDKDIASLIFLKGHLDDLGLETSLELLYIPYSRMDRTEGLNIFTLKYFARLINSLNFKEVKVYEAHSDVSLALIDKVKNIEMTKVLVQSVLEGIRHKEKVYLVYPDEGARKRYESKIDYDRVITASKDRDFETGEIKSIEINGEIEEGGFDCIIVDDLCSRGGTFILIAEKLKKIGAKKIYLVVTHCENTVFEGDLLKGDLIENIVTTNSILDRQDDKIIIKNII